MNQHTTNDKGPGRQSRPFDRHTTNDASKFIAITARNASNVPPVPLLPPVPPGPDDPIERAIWDATLSLNAANWAVKQACAAVDETAREAKAANDKALAAETAWRRAETAWDHADDALKAAIKAAFNAKHDLIAFGFKRGEA